LIKGGWGDLKVIFKVILLGFLSWPKRGDGVKSRSKNGGLIMGTTASRVAFVKTVDRKQGVKKSIQALKMNPVQGKNVLIKPNFNTADPCPGSTHSDTLVALAEELWAMGAKSISLGERSYPLTQEVMRQKGILPPPGKIGCAGA
jgi:hypothetical protein